MTRVDQLIKEALLSKDRVALNAYKNLKSELQKVLTAKNAPKYSEALFIQVTAKYAKSLEDAIKQFSEAHRDDLVAFYTSELEVLKKLLPEPVDASDIEYILYNWADELNFMDYSEVPGTSENELPKIRIPKKEMGSAIKHLKMRFPTADGKMIAEIVKKYLV